MIREGHVTQTKYFGFLRPLDLKGAGYFPLKIFVTIRGKVATFLENLETWGWFGKISDPLKSRGRDLRGKKQQT